MQIVAIEPHPQLRPYVLSYRIVEDKLGEYAGTPIWTCPEPVGILSANFGQRSYHESGVMHPKTGLLGLQTCSRQWLPQSETLFVMAILTVPGMMALFPNTGPDTADRLLDVADIWGQRRANEFWHCFPHELHLDAVKSAIDGWLLNLFNTAPISVSQRCLQLYQVLMSHKRIDTACRQLGITPRTLQREFQRHLGISPKQVLNLQRLQGSVKANLGAASPNLLQEFADQAHAIRTWNRYLSRTPSCYGAEHQSDLARVFAASAQRVSRDPTIFYL
ncbi:MAG: helix-turn-helix domain-containing protein [Cyanobacteria bacterium P01_H01_bin.121]